MGILSRPRSVGSQANTCGGGEADDGWNDRRGLVGDKFREARERNEEIESRSAVAWMIASSFVIFSARSCSTPLQSWKPTSSPAQPK